MRFPHFRKRIDTRKIQEERVFAEASELAQHRLESSIADLKILLVGMKETGGHRGQACADENVPFTSSRRPGPIATPLAGD